jgi:hypothetical protein
MKIELISLARLARVIERKHRVAQRINQRLHYGANDLVASNFVPLTRD